MQRLAVGDRGRHVVGAHDAAAVIGLEAAAVAAAMVDEVDPRLARVRPFRRVQRMCDERRQVVAVGHVVRLIDVHVTDVAVGDRVRLRAQDVRRKEPAPRRRVFNRELDG